MFKPRNLDKIKKEREEKVAPRLERRFIIMLLVVEALFLLLAIIAIPLYYTSTPVFYDQYYSDKSYYQAWKLSTHAEVSCIRCHVEPGFVNDLSFKTGATYEFYVNVVKPAGDPLGMEIPSNQACEQCHTPERIISPTARLIIPHQMHVAKIKLKCTDCHKWLVHQENPEGSNTPSMRICYRCHNNKTATARCLACHRVSDPENYLKILTPKDHTEPGADWLKAHGKKAIADKEYCDMCHFADEKFCSDKCHGGVPLPHSQRFKVSDEHGKASKANRSACLSCHKTEQFCADCHHPASRGTRIPWLALHPSIFKVDRQACFQCHTPHYCAKCHIRGGKQDNPIPTPPPY